MSILNKYISKEILKQFAFVLIAVICIYLVVDFFEKSDNFARVGLPFSQIAFFFLLNIPQIVMQITPVGILLAVIIVLSLMKKNNEILALESSGVSPRRLLIPVVALGVIASISLFLFSDIVVPAATIRADRMWIEDIKRKPLATAQEKDIWLKGDSKITHIKYYNPNDDVLFGITVNYFDRNFKLFRKIDAERGSFENDAWVLEDVIEQHLNQDSGRSDVVFHDKLSVTLDFVPEDLKRVVKKPEEMSFNELIDYIHKVEAEGYAATEYRVDLYAKPAYAFTCVIMCIIATGLSIRRRWRRSIFPIVSYGIVTAFIYWIFYSFCLSLGYGEILPPIIAAWIANAVFLGLGILIQMG